MGIGFVLLLSTVVLTIAACVGAVILSKITTRLLKHAGPRRKRAVLASAVFPFACVVFAGEWFVAYALLNNHVFHRDPGLGDSWFTPLPNGYALLMIDVTDQGTVYNPVTQLDKDSIAGQDDAVFGVRQLQVSNALIFGASDSKSFDHFATGPESVDTYFELNTIKKTRAEFRSRSDLQKQAATEGIVLNLRDFSSVFNDYRSSWFDYAALSVLLLVPFAAFLILTSWIWKSSKNSRAEASR